VHLLVICGTLALTVLTFGGALLLSVIKNENAAS
jgi:hypothetical protein